MLHRYGGTSITSGEWWEYIYNLFLTNFPLYYNMSELPRWRLSSWSVSIISFFITTQYNLFFFSCTFFLLVSLSIWFSFLISFSIMSWVACIYFWLYYFYCSCFFSPLAFLLTYTHLELHVISFHRPLQSPFSPFNPVIVFLHPSFSRQISISHFFPHSFHPFFLFFPACPLIHLPPLFHLLFSHSKYIPLFVLFCCAQMWNGSGNFMILSQ